MKSYRERELNESGLVGAVKQLFGSEKNISDKHYLLITDYIDCLSQLQAVKIDCFAMVRKLSKVLDKVEEVEEMGLPSQTIGGTIILNSKLNETLKRETLFFELTKLLQTYKCKGVEQCGFYNGRTGLFFTDGINNIFMKALLATERHLDLKQSLLKQGLLKESCCLTDGVKNKEQLKERVVYLYSLVTRIPITEMINLAFKQNGREILKKRFELIPWNDGMFETMMLNLEKIYTIENLGESAYRYKMEAVLPSRCQMRNDGPIFKGNFQEQVELINKIQTDYLDMFFACDYDYIIKNYQEVSSLMGKSVIKEYLAKDKTIKEPELTKQLVLKQNN